MRTTLLKVLVFAIFLFFNASGIAQNPDSKKQAIAKAVEDYFFLERENIHVQPNKFVYLSDEDIWLKGYVYHRKKHQPFFSTTNIYAILFDSNGNKMQDNLFYGSNGRFTGKFELGNQYKTGRYYIQTFTNWMNNFKEDESSITEIEIINKTDNYLVKRSTEDIKVDFFPEGGHMVEGVNNSVGIYLSDCLGNALNIQDVDVVDNNGKVFQRIKISKNGYGRFLVFGDFKSKKIAFTFNEKKFEYSVPNPSQEKIGLEINNFTFSDKTIAKIRTSPQHLPTLSSELLYFVIQQDDKTNIFDLKFGDSNEVVMSLSHDDFFEGLNTIRIIDGNNKQLASRAIFKYPEQLLSLELTNPTTSRDTINLSGMFSSKHVNIGVSILPHNTKTITSNRDIFNSFYLKPYLKNDILNAKYFFTEISKVKRYELDLALLNQDLGKYNWYDITNSPPTSKYTFDFGLLLKGVVNQKIDTKKSNQISIFSPTLGIKESTPVNDKNEFYFNNLVVPDSTFIYFSMTQNQKPVPLKVYPQIVNGRKAFNKTFYPPKYDCIIKEEKSVFDLPDFLIGSITLEDVEISSVTKKRKLKYETHLGNDNLRGYKVGEDDSKFYMDVLHFIRNNGFDVPVTSLSSSVQIYSRSRTTLNGAQSYPQLFIDNVQQMNFDVLLGMKMEEIDEIYINAHAIVPSIRNHIGLIKIYRKQGVQPVRNRNNSSDYEVKNAFWRIQKFKNKAYMTTEDEGFGNFGIIDWVPDLLVEEDQKFNISFPKLGQQRFQVLIEGFSADGLLISEIKTITLN